MQVTMYGGDVRTPEDAKRFVDAIVTAYTAMLTNIDQTKSNHTGQKINGKPIDFLEQQRDAVTSVITAARQASARFQDHMTAVDRTVRSDSSLHNTQDGRYMRVR